MRHIIGLVSISIAATVLAAASETRAGGLLIQEFGTPTQATASAGAQAKANDASTAMHNPAGMTRLDDHGLMITAGFLMGDIRFDAEPDTPFPGGDGGQQGGPGPVIGLHNTPTQSSTATPSGSTGCAWAFPWVPSRRRCWTRTTIGPVATRCRSSV